MSRPFACPACFLFFSSSAFRRTSLSCLEKKECLFLVWVSNCYISPTHEQTVYFWPSLCSVNSCATLGRAMENLPKIFLFSLNQTLLFIVSALSESIRWVESVWKAFPCLLCWLDHFKIAAHEYYDWPVVTMIGGTYSILHVSWCCLSCRL